ncbi:MAG: tRNA (adenosine(37)-N6)-threonylcarbamoyltransferase complex ATPase subunit type 1 TsaE [Pseudomonadota bacterium]
MKLKEIKLILETPQATLKFGETLGKHLMAGDLVALFGDLGAGKTQLVKGLALGIDISEENCITSPSYTIINEYMGRIPLYHFDFYRLEGCSEIENLGYEEYFEGRGITVIEWAEKAIHLLPENHLEIHINHLENDFRELEIVGFGDHYSKIIDKLL